MLVAEIFYPDTFMEDNNQQNGRLPGPREPVAGSPPPVHDFQNYQQYLQKRAGESEARSNGGGSSQYQPQLQSQSQQQQQQHCDGVDEMGCFQVCQLLLFLSHLLKNHIRREKNIYQIKRRILEKKNETIKKLKERFCLPIIISKIVKTKYVNSKMRMNVLTT